MLLYILSGQITPIGALILLASLLLAITVHEFAHAFAAYKLGDDTAKVLGRMSLNPLVHLDPLGTAMILLTFFGWGKPVPINPYRLASPLRDSALISFAGPLANIVTAGIIAAAYRLGLTASPLIFWAVLINLSLAIFNLIPIYPLDGFKIVGGSLPPRLAFEWQKLARYGVILLLLFVFAPFGGASLIDIVVVPVRDKLLLLLLGTSF